jgi:hypothetical protein
MNKELAEELGILAERFRAVRAALSSDTSLWKYHPMMVELSRHNADRLNEIFDTYGWPGPQEVGGSWALLVLLDSAISSPKVMRRGLELLRAAERRNEVESVEVAMLEDEILTCEGRPQLYGTQLEWDANGELSPLPIAHPQDVDVRRHAVALSPLAEDIEAIRAEARSEGAQPPAEDPAVREKTVEAWARSVGWRE